MQAAYSRHQEQQFFHRMIFVVGLYCAIHTSIYFIFDAYTTALIISISSAILLPLSYALSKKNYDFDARLIFCFSCNLFVFAVPFGIKQDVGSDLYYLTTLFVPLLVFGGTQRRLVYLCLSMPILFWAAEHALKYTSLEAQWMANSNFPTQLIHDFNSFAAAAIMALFIKIFIERIEAKNKALIANYDRLEYVLNSAQLASWEWKLDSLTFKFDERWAQMLGFKSNDISFNFDQWKFRIHPEDLEKVLAEVHSCIRNEIRSFEVAHRIRHENGTWVWTLMRGRAGEYDETGKVSTITGTNYEITKLKETEVLLSNIQTMAKIGSWDYDIAQQKTTWTEEVAAIYALPPTFKSYDDAWLSFYPPKELVRLTSLFQGCIEGKPFRDSFQIIDADGMMKWVELRCEPMCDASGKVFKVRGTIQDITEKKKTEDHLKTLHLQLEDAQKIAKIGSWIFKPQTSEMIWSKQLYEIFNENPELPPPTFEQHFATIHPDDKAFWLKYVNACMNDGVSYKFRFRVVAKNNQISWIEANGHAKKDKNGRIVELTGTCQDVSEIVAIEEQAKMERAKAIQASKLASLGEMAAGVAHEINNPLSIINGYAHILNQSSEFSFEQHKKLEAILRATERISKIVTGLRKFSRSSTEKVFKPRHLLDIITEAIALTDPQAKRQNVDVQLHTQNMSHTNDLISCDEIEISQVFINLINNSIDAVNASDEKWIKIVIFSEDAQLVVQVIDSGKGITPSVAQKMFQPFYTTKDVGQGTGLGLSIVKGILDSHQAKIDILTHMNHTCFEVRFNQIKAGMYVA